MRIKILEVSELISQYSRRINDAANKAERYVADLMRFAYDDSVQGVDVDVESLVGGYESWLRAHLEANGIKVLPFPDGPHESIVRRYTDGERPFGGAD